jgi:hypothetical protein
MKKSKLKKIIEETISEYNKSKGKQIIIKSNLEKNKYFNNCNDCISNFKCNSVV